MLRQAVVAATQNAAASFGAADEVGSVEEGKRADLLLLSTPSEWVGTGPSHRSPGERQTAPTAPGTVDPTTRDR